MHPRLPHSFACLLVSIAAALPPAMARAADESPIPSTGPADERLAPFDKLMIDFLHAHPTVPGASLAVARHGVVVYDRGFGYADHQRQHLVHPNSQFRIASVTKPLTAVAVLQLVEQGKLQLSDHIFDVLQLKPPEAEGVRFDPRWHVVTIHQLLQHTGGWDRDKSFDPMFASGNICNTFKINSPARQHDIIRYMLRHPLDFDPGTRYAYSNFGYCLLGRVIERASGEQYEEYVQKHVLQPVGAQETRLGKTLLDERLPNEVWYDCGDRKATAILGPDVGKPCSLPYGAWCLEAMDSHGGWVATAADLVRFAAAFDRPQECKLLLPESIETMFAPPPGAPGHEADGQVKKVYCGCGWSVRPLGGHQRNTWHTGLLAGTSTLLVRRSDGLSWAVLFNSFIDNKTGVPANAIDPLVHKAANAVQQWP